jgi:hypothetical protein
LPNAVAIKSIKNDLRKSRSVLVLKTLVEIPTGSFISTVTICQMSVHQMTVGQQFDEKKFKCFSMKEKSTSQGLMIDC